MGEESELLPNSPFGNNSHWLRFYNDIGQTTKLVVRLHLIQKQKQSQIAPCLNYYQYHLKGISLLPRHDYGAYKQMPYEEAIDEKTYEKEVKKLGKLSFGVIKNEEADVDKFCNNDSCEIIPMTGDNDDQDYAN